MKPRPLPFLLAAAAALSGCAATGSYFADRGRDLADVASLTFATGYGAKVRAGPIHTGSLVHTDMAGLRGGAPLWGLPEDHGRDYEAFFPFIPFGTPGRCSFEDFHASYDSGEADDPIILRHKAYEARGSMPLVTTDFSPVLPSTQYDDTPGDYLFHPYWTQVDLAADIVIGVRVGCNPGELVDFVLGWFGADILDDDLGKKRQ